MIKGNLTSLRIVIATPDDIIRHGLKSILVDDNRISNIYEVKNNEMLRFYLKKEDLDLFLIDQDMINDLSHFLSRKIIIFTMNPNLSILQAAYKCKVRGYFSFHASKEVILKALDDSIDFILDPSLSSWIMPYLNNNSQILLEDIPLTRREREVDALIREGLNRRAIAERLVISESTLKSHLKNIAKKRAEIIH